MSTEKNELSDDFKVLLEIYEFNQRNEPIYYSKLVNECVNDYGLMYYDVSTSMYRLIDRGIIDVEYGSVEYG